MRASPLRWFTALALALAPSLPDALVGSARAAPGDRRVPEVIDMPAAVAEAELAAAGFGAERRDAPIEAGPAGTVVRQQPLGFAFATPGARVVLYVRGGAGPVAPPTSRPPTLPTPPPNPPPNPPGAAGQGDATVPNVRGMTEAEAIELLVGWRITILTVDSTPENEGRVTAQSPAAGSTLSPEGVVEISVGRTGTPVAPAGTAVVPSVMGLSEDAAIQALTGAGLVPLIQPAASSDPTKFGKVILQEPAAGTVVAKSSNIVVTVGRVVASQLNEAEVPDCSRLTEGAARKRLGEAGFEVRVKDRLATAAENGAVLEQEPAPMTRLLRGRTVTLTVGRLLMLPVVIPDVLNVEASAAERALREAGFEVERAFADTLPSGVGRVVAQQPPGNSSLVRGSFVRISIGRSNTTVPSTVAVPNVLGRLELQVRLELEAKGFGVRVNLTPGAAEDAGRIRGQNPAAGTLVAPGTEIALEVVRSETPQPGVPIPSYRNMDAATAQADLQAKGLRVALAYATGSPEGRVIDQQPPGGTVTVRGALVTLTISRAPSLGAVTLLEPANRIALPANHGLLFTWQPVADADEYQIEVMKWRDDGWQRENQYELRQLFMKVRKTRSGLYQWHVRARRAGGTVVGPWSEWRSMRIY